jgi:MerR family transcriptional regulator, redox-sensitive transcriptional activator SoxR
MTEVSSTFTIGQVARIAGLPITTLRYYERAGLIDPPSRSGGQRRYETGVFARLMLIRFCRIAGLTLDQIGIVIKDGTQNRKHTKELAQKRLAAIDHELSQLRLARQMMVAASQCLCAHMDSCQCGAMAPVIAKIRRATIRAEIGGDTA